MRTVDEIIAAIKAHPSIPPIHKQIMINRLDPEPTQEEIEAARRQVYDILLGEER